ncbi:hypothetical protein F5877DRAFT_73312 [Lentinula edodes]|nr:hypothetical protein F5877DRAFT_73312 [Lentinula edodes]
MSSSSGTDCISILGSAVVSVTAGADGSAGASGGAGVEVVGVLIHPTLTGGAGLWMGNRHSCLEQVFHSSSSASQYQVVLVNSIKCVEVVGAMNIDSEAHQANGTSRRSRPNVVIRQEAGGKESQYAEEQEWQSKKAQKQAQSTDERNSDFKQQ